MATQARLIHFSDEQIEIIEKYGRKHGIIAEVGRTKGEVNTSEVVRKAVEYLPIIERFQNGKQ